MANIIYRTSTTPTVPGASSAKLSTLTFDELDGNFKSLSNSLDGVTPISPKLTAYTENVTVVGDVSTTTYNINLALSNIFDITLQNNVTFTFTNPPAAGTLKSATIILRQGTGGSKTATFTNAKYTDGVVPILSTVAGQIDVMTFFTINGGSFWFGTFAMANVS